MRITSKLVLAALTAVIALAITAGTAAASRSFSVNSTTLRAVSLGQLTFTESEEAATIECNVTLNGSLHRLIAKVSGSLMGYVTEGRAMPCRSSAGATVVTTVRTTPAWHARLVSFSGTLPRITEVRIVFLNVLFLFRVTLFGFRVQECVYGGHIEARATVRQPESEIERVEILREQIAPLLMAIEENSRRCAREGELRGSFRLTPRIRITLH